MKRLIPFILLLLFSTSGALAQTTAGTVSTTGSGFYKTNRSKNTYETDTSSSISKYIYRELQINPSIGYFVADNLEIGVSGTAYLYSSIDRYKYSEVDFEYNNNNGVGKYFTNNYSVGPFLRKYFFLTERLALTTTSSVSYRFSSARSTREYTNWRGEENRDSSDINKSNGLSVSLGAGVTYFVTDKFGIRAGLGSIYYSRNSMKDNRTTNEGIPYVWRHKSNSAGFSFSPQYINLGLSYYFGGS